MTPDDAPFLRSINLCYDAQHPDRIGHFQPTAKVVLLINALLGKTQDRAFFIVAPFGSGKSLAATYLLHLIENQNNSLKVLKTIETRWQHIAPDLAALSESRRANRTTFGLVVALSGHYRRLPESIKTALLDSMERINLSDRVSYFRDLPSSTIEDIGKLFEETKRILKPMGLDRITIVWDEFGRHLQSIVTEGRATELHEIQVLAEIVNRSIDIPLTMGLLLHRGLFHYASAVAQSVWTEWKKVEGRFQTIQYVENSAEVYQLIADVISSKRHTDVNEELEVKGVVHEAKELGLFLDFEHEALEHLFPRAYPLEPTTLYLLPRLCARVAQNERTIFTFLYQLSLRQPVGPEALYDYFSPTMQSDTTVGGTYRQWLETQSALTKIRDDEEASKVIKTATLLGFGSTGERARASHDLLMFALKGYAREKKHEETVDNLIERKILLHRVHSNEVSVWHGTDFDLRGRLEEMKEQSRSQFSLVDFLRKEVTPPVWKPLQYNDDYSIRRYFVSEYHDSRSIKAYADQASGEESFFIGFDGKILYVLPDMGEDLHIAEMTVRKVKSEQILCALPRHSLNILDAALEVWCLTRMQHDGDLVNADPLVGPELQQMADDARQYLQRLTDRFMYPSVDGPRWFLAGQEIDILSASGLRRHLSGMMSRTFPLTPKINNEMIVCKKPSPNVINARKKLLLGILERSGTEMLGISGNFPDASMFRTVLLHTGLYRKEHNGRWGYAQTEGLKDGGLREIWQKIKDFLTIPSEENKSLESLLQEFARPPWGLRPGLFPILLAAGFRAFPSIISLRKSGMYMADLLPSDIEHMCKEPNLYDLRVCPLDNSVGHYLSQFHRCFTDESIETTMETDLIRRCYDALEDWKTRLPPAALSVQRFTDSTLKFQKLIRYETDPLTLLLDKLPRELGIQVSDTERLLEAVKSCKTEMESLSDSYKSQAIWLLRKALDFSESNGSKSAREVVKHWADCFSDDLVQHLGDGIAKSLISRMRMPYNSDNELLESLSSLLVGKAMRKWDDSTATSFEKEVKLMVRQIEDRALLLEQEFSEHDSARDGIAAVIEGRISQLYSRLAHILGPKQAKKEVQSIVRKRTKELDSGHH